jgi:hypothetical protein
VACRSPRTVPLGRAAAITKYDDVAEDLTGMAVLLANICEKQILTC